MSLTTALNNITPGRPPRLACSSVDLLWVMSYGPGTGDQGTPIHVNFTCKADLAIGVHIRLVVGRRAVTTQVHGLDAPGCGHWQLTGHAPSFSKQRSTSPMVPLTIQAVDKLNQVVDSVTFGDFVYQDTDAPEPPRRPSLRTSVDALDRPKRRNPYSQPQTPSSSDSEYGSPRSPRPISQTLRRASRQQISTEEDTNKTVILDITTPLDDFCFDWDESELNAGRRLVRFRRLQDGNKLIVSAERISQAEYDPDDIVISCIYRQETDACCVTSVDIIHLLQRLVEADFEVDEKNRIRRNLEGLRPTTVSKTRPGFEAFFQRIMDFPDPKPRKIEKDVKVFDWKLLPHALDKILSKYSLCAPPTTRSPKDQEPTALSPQGSTSGGTVYADIPFQLPREPSTNTSYLSHLSPNLQRVQFPSECSPDSSPELHRRASLPEDQLQSIYLDSEVMRSCFPVGPDLVYGTSVPPMYTADPPVMLHDTLFVGDQARFDWTSNDALLTEPLFSPVFGYNQSDSTESDNLVPALQYPAFDAFEFQTQHHMTAQHA